MIDESSMTGETHTKTKDEHHPFLWSGTKVQDGNCKMLVTGVGMNTEWGRLMATLGDGGDDETPLQVKLNGVATLVGKIGLGFAVLTFLVLLGRFLYAKQSLYDWSSQDAITIVDYFAIAVTIIVVAIPEGLPLAVTLTLAFAMTKMMDDKALVRHLSACETMGSATTICTDKTGTLTSNEMTVVKAWAAGSVHEVRNAKVDLPIELLGALLDGAFMNCTADVWDNNDGSPPSLLGSPTETAILKFGLKLGGNFKEVCSDCEVVKMEPFNSTRKRMGAVVKHENGDLIAHWKGASEIVLGLCDQTFDANGSVVELDEQKVKHLKGVIRMFADEALRTLCLAFRKVDRIPGSHEPIPDKGFILAAIVGIKDPLRSEVKDAVRLCHEAGIQVRMVTGDNLNTAVAIAQECGIYTKDGTAMEGPEFRNLSHDSMKKCIKKLQVKKAAR
jgi:Ca2+-transporting ATPase